MRRSTVLQQLGRMHGTIMNRIGDMMVEIGVGEVPEEHMNHPEAGWCIVGDNFSSWAVYPGDVVRFPMYVKDFWGNQLEEGEYRVLDFEGMTYPPMLYVQNSTTERVQMVDGLHVLAVANFTKRNALYAVQPENAVRKNGTRHEFNDGLLSYPELPPYCNTMLWGEIRDARKYIKENFDKGFFAINHAGNRTRVDSLLLE